VITTLSGPTLETERLLLRVPGECDFDGWAALMAHPEATRFLGGPQERAAAWRGMAAMVGAWVLRGFGPFSVVDKASGRWAGRVGPWRPEGWPGTEIAWSIAPDFQRRGFATEAAAATIDWAFDVLGWSEVVHCIAPGNVASIAVARRLGAERLRRGVILPPSGTRVDLYGQSMTAWRRRRGGERHGHAPS
jgi:RimJ/RimL family protein N-acetyltransferase